MAMELIIDVPCDGITDWVKLLRPTPDVTMCRIPAELVETNDAGDRDYEPKYISIGPYHLGKEELSSMQKVKLQYLNDLLARSNSNTVERYKKAIGELSCLSSEKAKYFELDAYGLSDDNFLKILVLDGCFLVELLLKYNDGSLTFPGIDIHKLNHDLMLIENQIPFSVLKLIYQNTDWGERGRSLSLFDLAVSYLHNREKSIDAYKEVQNVDHLLHLLYICRLNRLQSKSTSLSALNMLPWVFRLVYIVVAALLSVIHFYHWQDFTLIIILLTISGLVAVIIFVESGGIFYLWEGVSFVFVGLFYLVIICVEEGTKYTEKTIKMNCPLIHGLTQIPTVEEITYSGIRWSGIRHTVTYQMCFKSDMMNAGLMEINDNSFSEFENLLFYEQIYFLPRLQVDKENDHELYISTYVMYMRNMVKTEMDVTFLKKLGILRSTRSSMEDDREIIRFFRKERPWLVLTESHQLNIHSQFESLEEFFNSGHRKRKAKLRKEYFVSTRVIFAFQGFIIVTALTAIQAIK